MSQNTFVERLAQRRTEGRVVSEVTNRIERSPRKTPTQSTTRRATIAVPMPVVKTLGQLLSVLAAQHQLAAITLSDTPTKKELLAILENRTLEVLDAVNGHT